MVAGGIFLVSKVSDAAAVRVRVRRIASKSFWLVAAAGGAIWLFDVIYRLQTTTDTRQVWIMLLVSASAGALLQGFFSLTRFLLIRRNHWLLESFGHWTGGVMAVAVAFLAIGSWVFDLFDPLSPIAFLIGFSILWMAVGGHREWEGTVVGGPKNGSD